MKDKIFKLNGINYYVVNASSKKHAVLVLLKCRAGVTENDISEVERLDESAEVVYDGAIVRKFSKSEFDKSHFYDEKSNCYPVTAEYMLDSCSI